LDQKCLRLHFLAGGAAKGGGFQIWGNNFGAGKTGFSNFGNLSFGLRKKLQMLLNKNLIAKIKFDFLSCCQFWFLQTSAKNFGNNPDLQG